VVTALSGQGDPVIQQIVIHLRLPRTLAAFVTGGLLSLAGAMMQVLLRNPLADPYVLSISGGAAVASLVCILCGLTGYALMGGAWVGSFIATVLVFSLTRWKSAWQSDRVLLTGIALASGFSALISFILLISPDKELHGMLFWLLGDLSYAHLPILEMFILSTALILSLRFAKQLNLLVQGETQAKALGISTERLQIQIYFLTSLLTAAAVALAGCIGFVGLVVPHMFRLLWGYDHRWLLPGSVLLGGSLLTLADTFSRTLFAPQQLPVGIMMAMIGIPVFLFLLQKNHA
jgi:iron complex transport system permease protein